MTTHAPTDPTARTRWRLDPDASTAEFRVPHFWGLIKVKGRFAGLDGWLELRADGAGELELTIDAASLSTRNRQRDRHLRSADFFDADRHPHIRFRSTRVETPSENELSVHGALEVRGSELAMTLRPAMRRAGGRLQLDVAATVDQRNLGITWSPLGMTRTPASLTVHAELTPDG